MCGQGDCVSGGVKMAYETLLFFFLSTYASYPASSAVWEPSLLSTEPPGLEGGFERDCGEPRCGPSLKIWTVSCAELTASSVETKLKFIEYIRASRVPLRN